MGIVCGWQVDLGGSDCVVGCLCWIFAASVWSICAGSCIVCSHFIILLGPGAKAPEAALQWLQCWSSVSVSVFEVAASAGQWRCRSVDQGW